MDCLEYTNKAKMILQTIGKFIAYTQEKARENSDFTILWPFTINKKITLRVRPHSDRNYCKYSTSWLMNKGKVIVAYEKFQ